MPFLRRAGMALYYEETGTGDPPLLLVHGIACDHTYLAPQCAHFRSRQRVVAVDLRGHGRSEVPVQGCTIDDFAADLAWLCGQLGLDRPLVVGHSMGGLVALTLAALHPLLAVVALDSTLLPAPERLARMRSFLAVLEGPRYEERLRDYFAALFGPADDALRRERILQQVGRTPARVVAPAWWDGLFDHDVAATIAACPVPVLYVDAGTPNADLARLAALLGDRLSLGRTVGSGHFNQLEVPDQVSAMIDRFLTVTRR